MNIIIERCFRLLASWFVFPKKHLFHGQLQTDPEIIEIPTIFTNELPANINLQSLSPKPQVTFTTGVVTVIFVTITQ